MENQSYAREEECASLPGRPYVHTRFPHFGRLAHANSHQTAAALRRSNEIYILLLQSAQNMLKWIRSQWYITSKSRLEGGQGPASFIPR